MHPDQIVAARAVPGDAHLHRDFTPFIVPQANDAAREARRIEPAASFRRLSAAPPTPFFTRT
jgi:hypothetical protein